MYRYVYKQCIPLPYRKIGNYQIREQQEDPSYICLLGQSKNGFLCLVVVESRFFISVNIPSNPSLQVMMMVAKLGQQNLTYPVN